jgi:hypothetical protein
MHMLAMSTDSLSGVVIARLGHDGNFPKRLESRRLERTH